jgi:hypothetical protein
LADYGSREIVRGEMALVVEGAAETQAAIAEAGAQAALAAAHGDGGAGDVEVSSSSSSSSSSGGAEVKGPGRNSGEAAAAAGAATAAAAAAAAGDSSALKRMIAELLRSGASVSSVSRQLSQQLGVGRSQLYKLALQVEAAEQARVQGTTSGVDTC